MNNIEIIKLFTGIASASSVDLIASFVKQLMETDTESENIRDSSEVLRILEDQTKILRELAISRRIDTAEKVSIEEYYEGKGDGKLGAQLDASGVNIGVSGSGERVVKRVYTFEGWREGGLEGLSESIIEKLKLQGGDLTEKSVEIVEAE